MSTKINRAIGVGESSIDVFPPPVVAGRAPTSSDINYPVGQKWIYNSNEYTFVGSTTWDLGGVGAASTTEAGVVRLATVTETETGTAVDIANTPAGLAAITKVVTVVIETTEVALLATTPIELVAAPGADKILQFISATFVMDYNSVQYTESGDNLGIKYTDASGVQVSENIECTGFIDQAADMVTNAINTKDNIVTAAGSVNKALVLDNLGSNFGSGNSELTIRIAYRVVTAGL